jgi:uncharacterized protein YmfQ (DUF2313 family)
MSYTPLSRHYSVLKQLFPLALAGDLDVDLDIEGLALDRAEDCARRLHQELFPDTSSSIGALASWERTYGIIGDPTTSDQQRAGVVVAKMRNLAGLNRSAFYRIARALGYNTYPSAVDPHIQILDGIYLPFRVGIGMVGDPVYFGDSGYSIFSVYVKGTGVASDSVLQALFNAQKRPSCEFVFQDI